MQENPAAHQKRSSTIFPETASQDLEQEYTLESAVHRANPYALYARMRKAAPVFFSPQLQAWVVSRYEDVAAVLRDHQRFAFCTSSVNTGNLTPETLAIMGTSPFVGVPSITMTDPPVHTRLRGAITRAMSAQRIASLEPRLRQLANRLIDEFEPDGRVDFVTNFARLYPVQALGSLLNVPEADQPYLHGLADDVAILFFTNVSAEQQLQLAKSYVAQQQYVSDLVEQRRKEPQNDLASDLPKAVDEGQAPLSVLEAADLLYNLLGAGSEVTVKFLGNALFQLLSDDRRYWKTLVDNPDTIPAVVEEVLRFSTPVLSTYRQTTQEVELDGKSIPKGAILRILLTSANRDEAVFSDAETFDPDREKATRHATFGYGVHFCLGAPLARLETRIALEQLSRRLPSLRLASDQEIEYSTNLVLRSIDPLLIEW